LNGQIPRAEEFLGIFSNTFDVGKYREKRIPLAGIIHHPLTDARPDLILIQQLKNGPSSRELALSVALEQNKINQTERDQIVHEIRDRASNLSLEQEMNLRLRKRYELSFMAHATDNIATQLQWLELDIEEKLKPIRMPALREMYREYNPQRTSSLLNRIAQEKTKEAKRELIRGQLRKVSDDSWDAVQAMMDKCTKREEMKEILG